MKILNACAILCILSPITAATGDVQLLSGNIKLTNGNSSAQGKFTVQNFDTNRHIIGLTKKLYGAYNEQVSWGLDLSQKYANRGDVSVKIVEHTTDKTLIEYVLSIGHVTLEDYALYQCSVYERDNGDYRIIDNPLNARFQEPAHYFTYNSPICSSTAANYSLRLVAGTEVAVTCSHSGTPPLVLQWYNINGSTVGDVIKDYGPNDVTLITQIAHNQLQVTLGEADDGAMFICKASAFDGPERQCVVGPLRVASRETINPESPIFLIAVIVAPVAVIALLSILVNLILISRLRKYKKNADKDYVVERIGDGRGDGLQQRPDEENPYYSNVAQAKEMTDLDQHVEHAAVQGEGHRGHDGLMENYGELETTYKNKVISVKERRRTFLETTPSNAVILR